MIRKEKILKMLIISILMISGLAYSDDKKTTKIVKKIYIREQTKKNTLFLLNGQRKNSDEIQAGIGYKRMLTKEVSVNFIWMNDKNYIGGVGIDW